MIKCFMCKDTQRIVIGGDNSESCFVDGFFVTKEELEQLQREAFRAGRAGTNDGEGYIDYDYLDEDDYLDEYDYLSSKSKEGAE